MSPTQVAHAYIQYLELGDLDKLLSLFAEESVVVSPIYGTQKPGEFYPQLLADTNKSQLAVKGIFEEPASGRLALYFNYQWTLRNEEVVNFDVVDILEFDGEHKIANLTIIYDTVNSRRLINEQNSQP